MRCSDFLASPTPNPQIPKSIGFPPNFSRDTLSADRTAASFSFSTKLKPLTPLPPHPISSGMPIQIQDVHPDPTQLQSAIRILQSSPPTWQSAFLSNVLILIVGFPVLVSGLTLSGLAAAFLLGLLTWRAFASSGSLLVGTYFVIGTAVTKVKMVQKEAQGIAEKRRGRRGPASVIGSSAAGCVCAFLSIYGVGGPAFAHLWELGFVACFCTKLSDTVSSEIGKAYGKTTYLITTFKKVSRGTDGAISVEGTFAGLVSSIVLASVSCLMAQISCAEAVICVIASQIANLGESIIGASLQEKQGFGWLNNDMVNIVNISMGSILAILMRQLLLHDLTS